MKKIIQTINVFQKINTLTEKNDARILQFLNVDKVDLKFIFDNIRNYVIASSIMGLGVFVNKHHQPVIDGFNFSLDAIWGIILIILGLLLNILNFIQLALALNKLKLNMLMHCTIGMLLFFLTSKIFMGSFIQKILSLK